MPGSPARSLLIFITVLGLSLANSGCGFVNSYLRGDDNRPPPAELTTLANPIGIQTQWSRNISSGSGDGFNKLRLAVNNSRVFVAGHEGDVAAADLSSGQIVWRADTNTPISAGVGISENLILVGSTDGDVIALSQDNGSEVWRSKLSSEILAAPVSANGIVVVRTIDGNFTGLASRDGSRLWGYNYTVPILTLRGTSTPVITQNVVFAGLDNGKLLLLSLADGRTMGEKNIAFPRGRTELERIVDIDAELKLSGQQLFSSAYQGNISALDLTSGNTIWQRDVSGYSGVDADERLVYLSDTDDTVWALDRLTGATRWQQNSLSYRQLSAPTVVGDYLVVGDFDGYLHWLDKSDGSLVGRSRIDSSSISVTPLATATTLLVLSNAGQLSALRAQP